MPRVSGPFDVKLVPQPGPEPAEGITLARLLLDKQFHGPLSAKSDGQMLSAVTATPGSAGYVAIERAVGTLDGRAGSFVLQHNAFMNRGKPQLSILVVPDSGTGALAGIGGRMDIRIENGRHFYDFDYTLP